MLEAAEVFQSIEKVDVLSAVSVSVRPGRVTVLIGPSGAGKTTLVRALAFIDFPKAGTITLDGRPYSFPLRPRQRLSPPWPDVTVVFQQHFLWPHLTIRANMTLPLAYRGGGSAALEELVQLFALAPYLERFPNQVSAGERQRVALARAFVLRPKYVLLDEITSALDVEQSATLLRHLLALRERGIGMLIVTHSLGFAQRLIERGDGDQLVFIDHGRVVESGGVDCLRRPQTERLKQFVAAMELAS